MTSIIYPWSGMQKAGAIITFNVTIFILFVVAFVSPSVHAAPATLAESPALACLTRAQGTTEKLEYPPELLERKYGGTIPVKMIFRGPNDAPKVEISIDKNPLLSDFEDSVRDYVAGFRVPCMKDGDAPVTLRQEYVFTPNDGRKVVPSTPVDDADATRSKQFQCMINIHSNKMPDYPKSALLAGAQGKFLVTMRFDSPDRAPTVTWEAVASSNALREAVEHYIAELRIPCLENGPIKVTEIFNFILDDGGWMTLRDMTLKQFLGAARDMQRPVAFDLNSMNCPFDLRISYRRPYVASIVGELEESFPARKPLMDWLSMVTLNLGKGNDNKVLGDEFTLSIPCGSVNL